MSPCQVTSQNKRKTFKGKLIRVLETLTRTESVGWVGGTKGTDLGARFIGESCTPPFPYHVEGREEHPTFPDSNEGRFMSAPCRVDTWHLPSSSCPRVVKVM